MINMDVSREEFIVFNGGLDYRSFLVKEGCVTLNSSVGRRIMSR